MSGDSRCEEQKRASTDGPTAATALPEWKVTAYAEYALTYRVRATDREAALERVSEGGEETLRETFMDFLPSEKWSVEQME